MTNDQYAEAQAFREQQIREFDDLRVLGCPWPDGAPLEDLGLRTRDRNTLRREDLYTVGDVLGWSGAELLDIRQFGAVALGELRDALASKERAQAARQHSEKEARRQLDRAVGLLEEHSELLTEEFRTRLVKVLEK